MEKRKENTMKSKYNLSREQLLDEIKEACTEKTGDFVVSVTVEEAFKAHGDDEYSGKVFLLGIFSGKEDFQEIVSKLSVKIVKILSRFGSIDDVDFSVVFPDDEDPIIAAYDFHTFA